jgi:pimeloyl-ACP methyl ester carboxylesterase
MNTWIFLRGLMRESGHWGNFAAQFHKALPESRIVMLDLPGNGALHALTSPCRIEEMVAHCRLQLAQREIAPPYHVLAMSLGAMVALAWAQAQPKELAALVLINTSVRPFNPFYQRLRPANYPALLRLALFGAAPQVWERSVLGMTSNRVDESVLPLWLQLRQQHPVSRATALRQLLAAARYRAPAVLPPVPTLVLSSAQDQLVSPHCSQALARAWHCALRVHASAGHDLPLDDGPWVAQQVCQWRGDWAASDVPDRPNPG